MSKFWGTKNSDESEDEDEKSDEGPHSQLFLFFFLFFFFFFLFFLLWLWLCVQSVFGGAAALGRARLLLHSEIDRTFDNRCLFVMFCLLSFFFPCLMSSANIFIFRQL